MELEERKALCKAVADFCELLEHKCYTNKCPFRGTGCMNSVSFTHFYFHAGVKTRAELERIAVEDMPKYDKQYPKRKEKDTRKPKDHAGARRHSYWR